MPHRQKKSYCRWCGHDTNHEFLFSHKVSTDNDGDYWEEATYSVVKCCGCDAVAFHREVYTEYNFDEVQPGIYDYIPEISCFPFDKDWINPIFSWAIPHTIRDVYREAVEAMNHGLDRLAGAGFRAVVESVCSHLKIEGKTLEVKINKLTSQGIITKNDRNRLHAIRFIGNDSIHVLKKYGRDELKVALSIVNGILTNLFVIADDFERLSEKPISEYDDFEKELKALVAKVPAGVYTLKNIIQPIRRILNDDIPGFEAKLKGRIESGEIDWLLLCPPPKKGPQQYKIEHEN
ncbi:MAG: DUF4145 domain-containing protein [Muribaculaceae bacterium]|nr:DUF4145 domain-containing protein [Muribaculaceae bacterium]